MIAINFQKASLQQLNHVHMDVNMSTKLKMASIRKNLADVLKKVHRKGVDREVRRLPAYALITIAIN